MANFEETYEGLEDLIVRDQYFLTCPRDLQTFLKEQGKLDLKQMTDKSTNYIKAHGLNWDDYSSHKRDKIRETTDDWKGTNASMTKKFISTESKRLMRCFVCDKVGHKSVDCRARTQPNTTVRSKWGIRCYICSAFGHKAVDCPESKKGRVQRAAAMTVIPEEVSRTNEVATEIRPNHEYNWDGKEQVKLACGCIMPVVAGAHTVGNNVQFTHQGMAPICRGRINDVDVDVMRDIGSTSCVVRTDLVRETQKTGTSLCMLIDGTVKRYPTAIVELDTPSWSSTGTMHGLSSARRHHRKCTRSERPTTKLRI